MIVARPLVAGVAEGRVLKLAAPLSLWGGVEVASGRLSDPRLACCGTSIAGRVLVLPAGRGSSSSSAVLVELVHNGCAPAAIVLGRVDAILPLGAVVARELGLGTVPVLHLDAIGQAALVDGESVAIAADGTITRKAGPRA